MIDHELSAIFSRRSFLVLVAGGAAAALILARMMQLQIFSSKKYKKMAENNYIKEKPIVPLRGLINDRSGEALATNVMTYRAYMIPREVKDFKEIADILKSKFNFKKGKISVLENQFKKYKRSYSPVFLKENISWADMSDLRISNEVPGFYIEPAFSRIYPAGTYAAHAIGYVGNVSEEDLKDRFDPMMEIYYFKTGKTGLEKRFDASLRGIAGKNLQMTDVMGRVIQNEVDVVPAVKGEDVKTTLSLKIQKSLEDAFGDYPVCSGVVMEIETGEILAIASHPTFDPVLFQSDDVGDYFNKLVMNPYKPFTNKAIEGAYPPGSTFKIVVAMAALESGAITPNERIYCDESWVYGNHKYHCWKKGGHGWQNLYEALAHSCDIYFYQVALKIGIDAIKNMALKLGFGERLQNDLAGEVAGIIPDRRWKERNVGSNWVHGDTIISGIGQGFVLATPLQLCTMLCRVISNKRIVPKLVDYSSRERRADNLGFSKKNIKHVLDGLAGVTKKGGTAEWAAINVNGKTMGGKTGTSQVRRISEQERRSGVRTNEQLPWHLRNHGLFVGFAPVNNPKYAVAVVTEHSGGSTIASSITAKVMRTILKEDK